MAEQRTFNPMVRGSIPRRPTVITAVSDSQSCRAAFGSVAHAATMPRDAPKSVLLAIETFGERVEIRVEKMPVDSQRERS